MGNAVSTAATGPAGRPGTGRVSTHVRPGRRAARQGYPAVVQRIEKRNTVQTTAAMLPYQKTLALNQTSLPAPDTHPTGASARRVTCPV